MPTYVVRIDQRPRPLPPMLKAFQDGVLVYLREVAPETAEAEAELLRKRIAARSVE